MPVLPCIKPKPNSWLPESFGLRIGDPPDARHIPLAPGEAEILVGSLETAIKAGDETVAWRDESIPATTATLPATRGIADRSEEHTSELQSLMRISYDVFCLKKQKNTHTP